MATITEKPIDIGTLITRSPKIWGGKAILAGTRVPVFLIVAAYQSGMTPEEIARDRYLSFGSLRRPAAIMCSQRRSRRR